MIETRMKSFLELIGCLSVACCSDRVDAVRDSDVEKDASDVVCERPLSALPPTVVVGTLSSVTDFVKSECGIERSGSMVLCDDGKTEVVLSYGTETTHWYFDDTVVVGVLQAFDTLHQGCITIMYGEACSGAWDVTPTNLCE